jgi:hypothetical protein
MKQQKHAVTKQTQGEIPTDAGSALGENPRQEQCGSDDPCVIEDNIILSEN